jgi:hypothetical protein
MDRAAISELAKAKEAYVKELVSADKSLVMRYIAKKVEEKFGKALAPHKLRAAFLEAGGAIQPRGAKRGKRTQEAAATSKITASEPERRRKGRRKADKATNKAVAALENLGKHIVVIRNGDTPEVKEFTSPDKARAFLENKLSAGVPASALGYYAREALEVTVGI